MRSTLTLVTTFNGDPDAEGRIDTTLTLDGDQMTGPTLIAMHADALATVANMQARLCGLRTEAETLDMDGRRVY